MTAFPFPFLSASDLERTIFFPFLSVAVADSIEDELAVVAGNFDDFDLSALLKGIRTFDDFDALGERFLEDEFARRLRFLRSATRRDE